MAVEFPVGEHWFCVRTKPKKERMAAANIASMFGLDVFCPLIRFRRKTARGAIWFQEAMFPGYIFVRFEMREMKQAIAYAPGVMNVPMFNERYIAVPDSVIDSIRNDLNEEESVDAGIPLEVGEETTILDGSMRGLKVTVIKVMQAEDRVGVLLEMLGTLVEAEFPTHALEQRTKHRLTTD
jgi:transcriptional antiterminator RfaH